MNKLTAIKIKYNDGRYSDEIPVGVLAENVKWNNNNNLTEVLGNVKIATAGTVQDQIDALVNEKADMSDVTSLGTRVTNVEVEINGIASGTPPTADSTSEMDPNESTVYINTTDGKWYYWDGAAFQPGGTYGGAVTDTTLSISGSAADAKAVGDALALKADADDVGDLSQLTTTAKDDLVSAINEANEAITGTNERLVSVEDELGINHPDTYTGTITEANTYTRIAENLSFDLATRYKFTFKIGAPLNADVYFNVMREANNQLFSKTISPGATSAERVYTTPTSVPVTAGYILARSSATNVSVEVEIEPETVTPSRIDTLEQTIQAQGAAITDRLNSLSVLYDIYTNWEQGYIRGSNGTIGSDSKSCTSGYIESGGFPITLTVGDSYRTKVAHYNSSKEFVEILLSSSTGNREVIIPAGDFVRVQVSSDSDISPSDITDTVISLTERRYTDTNVIKTSGKPADAKEVFDFFDCLANTSPDSLGVGQGFYSITDGHIGTDGRYARTDKMKQSSSRIVFASIGAGYKFAVRMWDENNTFVSEKASRFSTTYQGTVPNGWTIAFNFENNEVSTLDNTDYEAIKSAFNVRMSDSGSEFVGSTIVSSVDFNGLTETGTYRLPSTLSGTCANTPTDDYGRLVVFGDVDNYSIVQLYVSYNNNVYTRILQYRDRDVWTDWAQIYNSATGGNGIGAYLHDGNILRMVGNPEAIPVNENHLGYNDFISATWANFLPDNYTDGDSYDASTTKIINVHVSRESDWMSTPYGANEDIYPIYRYTFTPVNGYQKTVLLTAGCHGNEAEGYWGLYRLMRMIYFEGYKYPTLRNLRNNVRFIVVPSWNPWGMQHYRRYNAFENKNLQAWNWLFAEGNQINVNGVVYDIDDVGEANVIWTTLQEFADNLDYWIDFHTDPYAGRTTSSGEIDDPRGYTPPYGFYGFTKKQTTTKYRLQGVMEDFYNLLKNEHDFTESWHLLGLNPDPSGSSGFSPWMASLSFPTALIEVSTFMEGFPYASGSADMMKMAQEFYGSCLSEFLR